MLNTLLRLGLKYSFLRVVLDRLRIREFANWWLRRFPLRRSLAESGVEYRMSSLDSLLVAREIFTEGAYRRILLPEGITTFADLGCNCGYFTCFLMSEFGRECLSGLLIDANPRMVAEANWHIRANEFENVSTVWGVVGADAGKEPIEFFLHPDDAGSSQFCTSPAGHVTRDRWQRIEVPSLSFQTEWRARFGDSPCDLLKIDIEGSEASFIENEPEFLRSVGTLVVEIHHWLVDMAKIERDLAALSFGLVEVLAAGDNADVRLYLNRDRQQTAAQVESTRLSSRSVKLRPRK
jgi:FkbM family methyltransferase